MPEPARQYDPVYDDDDSESAVTRPDLRALEGGGETTEPKRGHLKSVNDTPGDDKPEPKDKEKAASPEGLATAEQSAGTGLEDSPFSFNRNDKRKTGTLGRFLAAARGNKKKALAGGGIAGAIVGFIAIAFFMLIPLKIEHIVTNLQNRFFATSENAVQDQTQKMFTAYMVKHVLPGYKGKCTTTVDKTCSAIGLKGTNPVTNMYKSWSNAKLENKLATKYGIEFKYDKASKAWYLKAPGINGPGDNIGPNGERLGNEFKRADRAAMRSAWRTSMENETKLTKMFYRYKVGRLLEEKYGIKRCILFCGTRDALANKVTAQKKAAQLYLAERVIQPRNQMMFIAITCLLDENCQPQNTSPSDNQSGTDGSLNGEPQSDTETKMRTTLDELAAKYGVTSTEDLLKIYNDMSERGFQKYITDEIFQIVFKEETSKTLSDRIPIVGWINLAAQIVNGANDAGPKLKKLGYLTNATAAVSMYMTYRTYADEIHTGHVNSTEVGSWVGSLGPGNQGESNDPEVGGTAGAEGTPLYGQLLGSQQGSTTTATLIGSLLPGTAFADSTSSSAPTYLCNNNQVPSGKPVCSEEVLGQGSNLANTIHDFLNMPGMNVITEIAKLWKASFGWVFKIANGVISFVATPILKAIDAGCDVPGLPSSLQPSNIAPIPGYCSMRGTIKDASKYIMDGITKWLIPNPFGSNMSGGRKFDMMAAGSDVAGHDACEEQLGCESVSSVVYNNIVNQQQEQARQQFANSSLFARMFSTDSPYSLVSRVAMDMPLGLQSSAGNTFASFITSPFAILAHGFGSIFSAHTMAASTPSADPFGVTQVAFPTNEIPSDPEAYWDQHNCGDTSQNGPIYKWQKAAADGPTDPNNGMPLHSTTEPCLLIKATTGSAGGFLDSSLLTPDDTADVGSGQ